MPDTPLYLEAKPGDLITAENWNELQKLIRQDIADTTQKAVQGVTQVDHAKDSDELDGKTADQLADDIVRRAVQQVRLESGYQQIFTVLDWEAGKKPQEQPFRVIEHKLGLEPLVDVYRLQYFPVVYRRDQQTFPGWANFYLFQKLEQSIRYTSPENKTTSVRIQPAQGQAYRILWKSLLDRYHVKYDKQTSVADLLTDFWNALLGNQGFDQIQYGHSPFLEKCCDDNRTVNDLDQSGDWDDLYLKMMPEKIAFFPAPAAPTLQGTTAVGPANTPVVDRPGLAAGTATDWPTQVQVTHFDFDTVGLRLVTPPYYPPDPTPPLDPLMPGLNEYISNLSNELKVMVLLKV